MMQDALREHKENPEQWKDQLYRLCTYSGFDYDELMNYKISDDQMQQIATHMEFEREPLDMTTLLVPNAIKFFKRNRNGDLINFQSIRIPKFIDEEAVGKKIFFKRDVILYWHEHKDIVPVLHKAIAIYFQTDIMPAPHPDKPFNGNFVTKFEDMCLDCLFVEAFPVANFFLKKSISSMLKNRQN